MPINEKELVAKKQERYRMNKLLRKIGAVLLAVAAALSLAAGNGYVSMESTVAVAADKKITVKAASDFTLEFPADWKKQYVKKASMDKKHGSYVAFYSKKCYKETKEGWLFSIARYVDDSYMDMPDYELVGRWNGYNYVALFPTDVQMIGASKTAQKQYSRIAARSQEAAVSIQPVKKSRKEDHIYQAPDFWLKLPAGWEDSYIVEDESYCVAFYAKKCYEEAEAGWLFSIMRFEDDSYQEIPAWRLIGKWNGTNYVVSIPRAASEENVSEAAAKQYRKLASSVEKTAYTIQP